MKKVLLEIQPNVKLSYYPVLATITRQQNCCYCQSVTVCHLFIITIFHTTDIMIIHNYSTKSCSPQKWFQLVKVFEFQSWR